MIAMYVYYVKVEYSNMTLETAVISKEKVILTYLLHLRHFRLCVLKYKLFIKGKESSNLGASGIIRTNH